MESRPTQRSFQFLRVNERENKPRKRGLTEIRGPYYSVIGRRYLEDLFETMGAYVDSLKFAGGSFTLMPETAVRNIIHLCHQHDVIVSTGGFIERVLVQGDDAVRQYVAQCKKLGFDIIEISAGFVSIPTDDWLRLIELVRKSGLKAKPEVGIQFGAGGATDEIGMEKLMFEAADPDVFEWYIKNYGADVNLFVDHSQIVQLECLRAGIWGTKSLWGRVVTYRE